MMLRPSAMALCLRMHCIVPKIPRRRSFPVSIRTRDPSEFPRSPTEETAPYVFHPVSLFLPRRESKLRLAAISALSYFGTPKMAAKFIN